MSFVRAVCLLLLVLGVRRHELTELYRGKRIPELNEVEKKGGLEAGFEGSSRETGVSTLAFSC